MSIKKDWGLEKRLVDALGLPKEAIKATIKFDVNDLVRVECEYFIDHKNIEKFVGVIEKENVKAVRTEGDIQNINWTCYNKPGEVA
jgi:hypothetical protein